MSLLVASIIASSPEEMARALRSSTEGADVVEVRVDGLREPDLEMLRGQLEKPAILTCRSVREGGCFMGSEEERLRILRRGLDLGFDYVDIELSAFERQIKKRGVASKLIGSHHCFERFPDDLPRWIERGAELGADLVKLAVPASSFADVLRLVRLGPLARDKGMGFIPVAMGPAGMASRILAERLGADFTYATGRGLDPTGPGQLDLDELLGVYRFRSIGADTRIYGILGRRVTGSLSPIMHNHAMARIRWDGVYVPFEEERLGPFVAAARTLGVRGLSVTRPFKEEILAHLDEMDTEAARIGAVNTVDVRKGRWKGYNTDVDGVVGPVSKRIALGGKRAVILGAGGAARAAAFALAEKGARLAILARRPEQAERLAAPLGADWGPLEHIDGWEWDILVNATPVGSTELGAELPVVLPRARADSVVLDMVYDPEQTPLIQAARKAGAKVISGLEMLVEQALHQAEIWTGQRPPAWEMEAAARRQLEHRAGRRGEGRK